MRGLWIWVVLARTHAVGCDLRRWTMVRVICGVMVGMFVLAGVGFAEEADLVQGNWKGVFTGKAWKDKPITAQIVADGREAYHAILKVGEGAPDVRVAGKIKGKKAEFEGKVDLGAKLCGECEVSMKAADGEIAGIFGGKGCPGKFKMERVEIKPPTLGTAPPAGAVVLFDGKSVDAWTPTKEPWAIVEGGVMEVRKGNTVSKQEFGDAKYHVEFRVPLMPTARGQARGNSGVYIQGRYEVQVLDSFGLKTADNECGGIYKKATPKVNACLPPTEWQTYDITFHAPKFDESGKKVKNAVITVEQNGIVIHDKVEMDSVTPGGVSGEEAKAGPLLLQEHNAKVQYRNIWVQPL